MKKDMQKFISIRKNVNKFELNEKRYAKRLLNKEKTIELKCPEKRKANNGKNQDKKDYR